jgi:chromosome segregation ATPase
LEGAGLAQCRSNQQTLLQQQRLEQQLQQQQERQIQLDKQQREVQQQLESMRLQNESMRVQNENLRQQLEREIANPPARAAAANPNDPSKSQDVTNWKADNPWFGSDYARTQFAMRYVKQLQKERPDLTGRPLLDALSSKVNETFGEKH